MTKTKKSKKGICIYCGKERQLFPDHVPPKNIFPQPRPNNLITVPSCKKCNEGASQDDEYFRFTMVSRIDTFETDAVQNLYPKISRSLNKPNKIGFRKGILKAMKELDYYTKSGIYLGKAPILDVDLVRLNRVASRIIKGLFYHHTKKYLFGNRDAVAFVADSFKNIQPSDLLEMKNTIIEPLKNCKSITIGKDVFDYKFIVAESESYNSAWLLRFYKKVYFLGLTGTNE